MIRVALIAILFFIIARSFWRMVDGIVEGVSGPGARQKPLRPAVKLVKDPVCGTFVAPRSELSVTRRGETHYFCSEKCRREFR